LILEGNGGKFKDRRALGWDAPYVDEGELLSHT